MFVALAGGVDGGFIVLAISEHADYFEQDRNLDLGAHAEIVPLIPPVQIVREFCDNTDEYHDDLSRAENALAQDGRVLLVAGNPFDGFQFIGPFRHGEDALWLGEEFAGADFWIKEVVE
jgi:hypothetical protein